MNNSLSVRGLAALLVLAIMWGASFTFIKIAIEAIAPVSLAAGRISLAMIVLVIVAALKKEKIPTGKDVWLSLLGIAVLGNIAPFVLIGWGEQHVDSGLTSVLMSVVPLSVPFMAHYFTDDEKLTPYMVVGVIIGFCGLLVLVGPSVFQGLGKDLISQGAIITAALCYGSASIIARRLKHVPMLVVAAGSMTLASLMMVPAALVIDQPWTFDPDLLHIGSVIYLGLFPTALANILLFYVIYTNGVSFLALNNYLVPVFGVAIAALTLGETVPAEMLSALGIIFVGIFVSNLKRKSG